MRLTDRRFIPLVGLALMLWLAAWLLQAGETSRVDSYASCVEAGYPVSETEPPSCSDGHHTYLGPRSTPEATVAPQESLPFEILVTGDSGGAYPKQQEIITTQAQWTAYWTRIHASHSPLPPILPIDFKTHDVIALSEGRQMTGGYNLKITSISKTATGTVVFVTEQIPTLTCKVIQAISNRYFIASTEKLTEPVSFRITTDYRQCGP